MMICKKATATDGPFRLTERRSAVNVSEGTTMITTARSAAKAGTPRRLRRQSIGLLAAKSERFDFKTRCRKCGSTPTHLVCRGPIIIERTCHNCGDVDFLDAPTVATQWEGSHLRRDSSLANISTDVGSRASCVERCCTLCKNWMNRGGMAAGCFYHKPRRDRQAEFSLPLARTSTQAQT